VETVHGFGWVAGVGGAVAGPEPSCVAC
jgi:hypothetical protein